MFDAKRVLVVDDDGDLRHVLASALRLHGLVIDEAADGREALRLLHETTYAVVLLDLLMPVADGFAVLESLRATRLPSPPVVLVITGADRRVVDRLDAQTVHGIIRKPFDPIEIAAVVLACTEVKSRHTYGTMAMAVMSGAWIEWLSGKW